MATNPLRFVAAAPAADARRGLAPSFSGLFWTGLRSLWGGHFPRLEIHHVAEYTDYDRSGKPEITAWLQGIVGLVALILGQSAMAFPNPSHVLPRTEQEVVAPLRTVGRHFVDHQGRVVILRGVNLSGDAKVPPFLPCASQADLDRMAELGFNVIRMLFVWEAYEPVPGVYDEAYLSQLQSIAAAAWERGIYVIIDVHQDGFSRHCSRGAGAGFPRWAVSPRGTASKPDNSARCKNWSVKMATDPTTHRSFDDFFANTHGVRSRYLIMLGRISGAFARTPGVIGYDLLNEPWGDERRDLAQLYRDGAEIVRAQHAGSILFLEGHVTTNCGMATRLPRPDRGAVAYAPHYYRPLTIVLDRWHGMTLGMNRAFSAMTATSQQWDAPLFLGEFGVGAEARNAGDYVAAIYDRMDACLASGAQWNYSPRWNQRDKDGWNGEDFSILDSQGAVRPNYCPRPYPRHTAGLPIAFRFADGRSAAGHPALCFSWENRPELGETEIFVPASLFPPGSTIEVSDPGLSWRQDETRQVLACHATQRTTISIKMTGP